MCVRGTPLLVFWQYADAQPTRRQGGSDRADSWSLASPSRGLLLAFNKNDSGSPLWPKPSYLLAAI